MKKHYIPLDGKSNRQPLTLSFDSLLVQQIDDAVFTSRILQFLNDPKGGVKQLDNPKKQRLFASKENRSAFLEKIINFRASEKIFHIGTKDYSLYELAQMRETLLFLLTYKDIPVNLHLLLVPKKISIRPKKISTRYSQDVHQQKIEALKKSYIKCIRERKMSFIEAANSVLEDLEDTELIRFYFKIDCLTNDQIKKLCDCSEDKEQIFEIDDNALYQHNLSVLESFVHDRPYITDSTDKLAAFDEACNNLLSSVGDTTFCTSEDSIVDFNVDVARKCLSEALLCFAEKTGKEYNAEHLIVYAGLKNWIGDYSPTTPFSYPLLQFYLKHLF